VLSKWGNLSLEGRIAVIVEPADTKQANLLIISDLHLGEDLRPDAEGERERLAEVERDLVAFLEYYIWRRLDDRPWRLVINGDMVDFLSICLMPAEVDLILGLHPDDHTYGLGARPHAAQMKMQKVLDRHHRVFRALARFVGVGNDLSIVVGNHDAELFWPEVQETLRDGLVALWPTDPAAQDPTSRSPDEVGAAITFHPWFFFEEDLVYIEHGHQYDGYCSFDTVLYPVTPTGEEIDLNVSTAVVHYVDNHYAADCPDGYFDYLRWMLGRGLARGARIFGSYAMANLRLIRLWRQRTPEHIRTIRDKHLERLQKLASRYRLPDNVLLELDSLRQRPMALELGKIVRGMMIDRLALTAAGIGLMVLFLLFLPWGWVPAAGALAAVTLLWLDRRFRAGRETTSPHQYMRTVSRMIPKLVRTPIVVFGHAHDPVVERHEDGGWYFNTGAWVVESQEQVRRAFTHLRIRLTEDGPLPELRQWRKGRSLDFEPLQAR